MAERHYWSGGGFFKVRKTFFGDFVVTQPTWRIARDKIIAEVASLAEAIALIHQITGRAVTRG